MNFDLTQHGLQALCHEARSAMHSNVIIAGGAVRDFLNKKPTKDIDIFYQLKTNFNLGLAEKSSETDLEFASDVFQKDCESLVEGLCIFEENFQFKLEFPAPKETDSGIGVKDLCRLSTNTVPLVMEIIAIECDPVNDVHNYDFNISQCFVTPNELFMTQACRDGMVAREVRYMPTNANNSPASMQRSKRRLARLREKYADWSFSNCHHLDNLSEEQK